MVSVGLAITVETDIGIRNISRRPESIHNHLPTLKVQLIHGDLGNNGIATNNQFTIRCEVDK